MYGILDDAIKRMDEQDGKRRQLMAVPPSGYDFWDPDSQQRNIDQIADYRQWLRDRYDIHIVMAFI